MSAAYLKLTGDYAVKRLTLARSDVHNAFDAELIAEITAALRELAEVSSLRALVLAAEGTMFCAGADFHWMRSLREASYDVNLEDSRRLFDMFSSLYHFPHLTIARVQGGAFGGGAGLVACCDYVVMAEDAVLAFSEVRIGLVPATISPFVIRKIGEGKARSVFLSGTRISAREALDLGLAQRVVSSDQLDSAVVELTDILLQCGPEAVRLTKKLLREVPHLSIADARDFTANIIAAQRVSAEGQEGMASFLEKRKPEWAQ